MGRAGFKTDAIRTPDYLSRRTADVIDEMCLNGGWIELYAPNTWTYASSVQVTTSYTATDYHEVGDRVRWKQGGSYKYGYVYSVAAGTINITGGSDYSVANSAITDMAFSKCINPLGFPAKFNWSPTLTGFSADPGSSTYQFSVHGKFCHLVCRQGSNGTSNSTGFSMTAPITSATVSNMLWIEAGSIAYDAGTAQSYPPRIQIASNTTTIDIYKTLAGGVWTASGGKRVFFNNFRYPIA